MYPSGEQSMTAVIIFCLAYLGIALGKIPGLVIDRVGVALLGAIAMVIFGVVTPEMAVQSIDLPTILLLYSLMTLYLRKLLFCQLHPISLGTQQSLLRLLF